MIATIIAVVLLATLTAGVIWCWWPRRPLPEVPPWLVDPDRDRAIRLAGDDPDPPEAA